MTDIFLSYSHEDEARIKGLVSEFEAQGWSVFWDRRIPAGKTWRSYIGSALQEARCIVVAWSKYSIESQWVTEEADEGKTRNVLVPVLLDQVQPPHGFRGIQAADISNWRPGQESERITKLIEDLRRMLGKEPEPKGDGTQLPPDKVVPYNRLLPALRYVVVALLFLFAISVVGYFVLKPPQPNNGTNVEPPNRKAPWLVVAGSFGRANRQAAEERQLVLSSAGLDATLIDSNEYPLLTPNLWVVAIGPFESREAANAVLTNVKARVPDAYVKKGR